MKKYSGKGVYGAIAIGKISVLKKNDAAVTRVHVEDAAAEKARVEKAKQAAAEQLQAIHDKALKEVVAQFHPDRILIEPSGVGKLSDVIVAVQRTVDELSLIHI